MIIFGSVPGKYPKTRPKMIHRGPRTKYPKKTYHIIFDLRKSPTPMINVKTALAIRKIFFIESGMNGKGALTNSSTGHEVKTNRRHIDWKMQRQAIGRTLVLNAFSGVDILKNSNLPPMSF